MRFYQVTDNGFISMIGKGARGGEEITEAQHEEILSMLRNRPEAPEGNGYRLTETLEWELYELPAEDPDPELTGEEALSIILGGNGT